MPSCGPDCVRCAAKVSLAVSTVAIAGIVDDVSRFAEMPNGKLRCRIYRRDGAAQGRSHLRSHEGAASEPAYASWSRHVGPSEALRGVVLKAELNAHPRINESLHADMDERREC